MRHVHWALRPCSWALLSWTPLHVRAAGEVDCREGAEFRDGAEPRAVVGSRAKVPRPAELFLHVQDRRRAAAGAERAVSSTVRLDSPGGKRDLQADPMLTGPHMADRMLAAPHMADPMLTGPHMQVGA